MTNGSEAEVIGGASAAEIVGIMPDEGRMIVVHEDGTICTVDRGTRELKCVTRGSADQVGGELAVAGIGEGVAGRGGGAGGLRWGG